MVIPKNIKAVFFVFLLFVSVVLSKDFSLVFFLLVALSVRAFIYAYRDNVEASFLLSTLLLICYSYMTGLFLEYCFQALFIDMNETDRVYGYAALYSFPFLCINLLSIFFFYKSYKTKKYGWYIVFVILTFIVGFGDDEGYGSNYLFRMLLLIFNGYSFFHFRKNKRIDSNEVYPGYNLSK